MTVRDLQDALAIIEAENADDKFLFSEDGKRPANFRAKFHAQMKQRMKRDKQYAHFVKEATPFIRAFFAGNVRFEKVKQALTTSDFSSLFSDTLDRLMIQGYDRYPKTYRKFMKVSTVNDFRDVKRFRLYGGQDGLEQIGQNGEYPATDRSLASYSFAVAKYGKRYTIAWELLINDDLDAFRELPMVLGEDAAMAEMRFATALYAANATLYNTSPNGNKTTQELSLTNLEAAVNAMAAKTDEDGNPVRNTPKYLVISPQLQITAMKIVYPNLISPEQVANVNVIPQWNLEIVIDPFLPIVDATNGATSWYLFAEPGARSYAVEMAFLRGHEEPQLFEKMPDARPISGGALIPEASFANDNLQWKVRHVYGGSHANSINGDLFTYWGDGTA